MWMEVEKEMRGRDRQEGDMGIGKETSKERVMKRQIRNQRQGETRIQD